jgi:hypothetical protein
MIYTNYKHFLEFLEKQRKRETFYSQVERATEGGAWVQVLTGSLTKQMGLELDLERGRGWMKSFQWRRTAG